MQLTEGMRAFAKKYNRSLDDPKLRGLYELDLSARRDQAALVYSARREGHEAGRNEERMEIIRNMLADGMPAEMIYKYVNAPRKEIDEMIAAARKN